MTPSGVFHPGNNLGKKTKPWCLVAAHCLQIFLSFQINFVISAAPNSLFWSCLFIFLQFLLFASIYGPTQERQSSVSSRENTQPYLHICKLREIWRNSGNGDGLWGWKTQCQWGKNKQGEKISFAPHLLSIWKPIHIKAAIIVSSAKRKKKRLNYGVCAVCFSLNVAFIFPFYCLADGEILFAQRIHSAFHHGLCASPSGTA